MCLHGRRTPGLLFPAATVSTTMNSERNGSRVQLFPQLPSDFSGTCDEHKISHVCRQSRTKCTALVHPTTRSLEISGCKFPNFSIITCKTLEARDLLKISHWHAVPISKATKP